MNSVSVIIPVWNGEKTLRATIESCLNQTVPPLEILVCDDGSTDDSKNVAESLNDPRVIWVPGEHSGTPALPRNRGMSMAKGEWLAICDSDDEWLSTKLEKQLAAIKKLNYKAASTNAWIKIDGRITDKKVSAWRKETISFQDLVQTNNIVCSSAVIHSSLYKEIGGFTDVVEYGSFADYIYWLRITTRTRFVSLNEPLVIYDDHPHTSLRSQFLDDILIKKIVFEDFRKWAQNKGGIKKYLCILKIQKYRAFRYIKKLLLDR